MACVGGGVGDDEDEKTKSELMVLDEDDSACSTLDELEAHELELLLSGFDSISLISLFSAQFSCFSLTILSILLSFNLEIAVH